MRELKEQYIPDDFKCASFFSLPQISSFDIVEKDLSGNYHFIKHGVGEKIQIIFRIIPFGVMVSDSNKEKSSVVILGDEKKARESFLLRENKNVGILRKEKEEWFIEKTDQSDSLFGDILTFESKCFCKVDMLCASNLDEIIALVFGDFLLNQNKFPDKNIDFTVWNSSLSGESGLITALRTANADKIIFLSPADAKKFHEESSAAIVMKDGNYVLTQEQRDTIFQDDEQRQLCDFFVGKTDRALELLDAHGINKRLLGIYLPIYHYGSLIEEIKWDDLKKTHDILLKFVDLL